MSRESIHANPAANTPAKTAPNTLVSPGAHHRISLAKFINMKTIQSQEIDCIKQTIVL
jgi:hypothetical protein